MRILAKRTFPSDIVGVAVRTIARGRLVDQDELFVCRGCEWLSGLALWESEARFMGLTRTQERIE